MVVAESSRTKGKSRFARKKLLWEKRALRPLVTVKNRNENAITLPVQFNLLIKGDTGKNDFLSRASAIELNFWLDVGNVSKISKHVSVS